jgi:hypothetical protein
MIDRIDRGRADLTLEGKSPQLLPRQRWRMPRRTTSTCLPIICCACMRCADQLSQTVAAEIVVKDEVRVEFEFLESRTPRLSPVKSAKSGNKPTKQTVPPNPKSDLTCTDGHRMFATSRGRSRVTVDDYPSPRTMFSRK